ncbi:MAG: tetratricopeptide repeat protein, partial [Proteobacteria bacterium]|nr:tetratricopeptide repeat protein [Pseudomonadota bacterium]
MLRKFTFCVVASVFLWGCETLGKGPELSDAGSAPIGEFLRTAAANSQNSFNYPSAVNYYHNLYTRDPDDLDATLGLARNLRYIGASGQAADLLAKAVLDKPELTALRAELGKAQLASGEAAEAAATLLRVSQEEPGNWEVLSALGIAHDLLGQPDSAQRHYRAALELSPNNRSVVNNLALSMALSGDIDQGITLLREVSSRPGATVQVRQNLALMYAMKGDLTTAERLARLDLPPEMVEHNLEYYRRLYPNLVAGLQPQSAPITSGAPRAAAAPVQKVESEPVAVEPVEATPETGQAQSAEPAQIVARAAAPTEAAGGSRAEDEAFAAGFKIRLGGYASRARAEPGLT